LALVAIVAISAPALAQCSTLTVTGSINAGQTLTIDVSGAPANAITFLAAGNAGSTSIALPGGSSLDLGVASPFIILPIGATDASGAVSLSFNIPSNVPANAIQNHTYTAQAISVSFPTTLPMPPQFPMLSFCVSNTASVVSGTG